MICLLLLFGQATAVFSQHHISKYEFFWAMGHPFAAIKVKVRLKRAMAVYHDVKDFKQLDSFESGGTLDAFRHSFTMAYLAQRINVKKLRKLGIAHEKGNKQQFEKNKLEENERADSLTCEMDLRNNELGFLIGKKHKKKSVIDLKSEVLSQIKAGNAWILMRNEQKEYISCQKEPISLKNYTGKWFVPKCLIKSNGLPGN